MKTKNYFPTPTFRASAVTSGTQQQPRVIQPVSTLLRTIELLGARPAPLPRQGAGRVHQALREVAAQGQATV